MTQSANIENLASLLSLNSELETIPEPYRMQENLNIKIGFDTFKAYILQCSLGDEIMFIDCISMKDSIYRSDAVIVNYYYKYLAIAQLKEISIAQAYDAYATTILPEVDAVYNVSLDTVKEEFLYTSLDLLTLHGVLAKYSYPVKPVSENDKNFKCYALAAYYFSKTFYDTEKAQELFNITGY